MTNKEKIEKALDKKGYKLTDCYFEAISYNGPSGREGGWFIDFEPYEDIDPKLYEKWEYEVHHKNIIAICYNGFINAYNIVDVLKVIELIPSNE